MYSQGASLKSHLRRANVMFDSVSPQFSVVIDAVGCPYRGTVAFFYVRAVGEGNAAKFDAHKGLYYLAFKRNLL
jgi:hypothetical protein